MVDTLSSSAPLAIVSAMQEELRAVLQMMPDEQRVVRAGREFWVGRLHGREVVVVLSRIGKVAAATTATALIEHFGVAAVLFTGAAGGLASGVAVGDLVVADGFLQHDMDASPLFPRFEVPLYGLDRFATDVSLTTRLVDAATAVAADAPRLIGATTLREFNIEAPALHRGLVISGDRFVATGAESAALRGLLPQALAVEMEGAAVAQVCHDYGLPFAALRVISDRADDEAHSDFLRFMREVASRYSAAIVARFLATA